MEFVQYWQQAFVNGDEFIRTISFLCLVCFVVVVHPLVPLEIRGR